MAWLTRCAVVLCWTAWACAGPVHIENEFFQVRWRADEGTFEVSVRADAARRLTGRFPGVDGPARVVTLEALGWGTGQAIAVAGPGGRNGRVALFAGVPWVLVQQTVHNPRAIDRALDRIEVARLDLRWPGPARDVTVLGTGGLAAATTSPGSYAWLAVADPVSRAGVVLGWLTHERGVGVLLTQADPNGPVSVTARSDVGRLAMVPGRSVDSEWLALGFFDDARLGLEQWAGQVARLEAITLPAAPIAWRIDPVGGRSGVTDTESLARRAEQIAACLAGRGLDTLIVGDGWQAGDARGNGPRKDFMRPDPNGPFAKGMLAVANRIRSAGLRAGLWCLPFSVTFDDPTFAGLREACVQTADGEPFDTSWAGTSLDLAAPAAQDYVDRLIGQMVGGWGFSVLQLDGLFSAMAAQQVYPNESYREDGFGQGRFADVSVTPVQVLRDGLERVRRAAGPETFLLGAGASQSMRCYEAGLGRLDGLQVGRDAAARWAGWAQRVPVAGTRHYALNNRLVHVLPGPVFVGGDLTLAQAQAAASWAALSGQLFVVGDDPDTLTAERWDILRRTVGRTEAVARPVDLFEREPASVWVVHAGDGPARRDVVGLFNWQGPGHWQQQSAQRLELPPAESYAAFDFWDDRFLPPFQDLEAVVNAESCRVLAVRPARPYPQLLSTNRHVTGGLVDVVSERWDADSLTLRGTSRVQALEVYEMRIVVPVGRSSYRVRAVHADDPNVLTAWRQAGPRIRVTLTPPQAGEVSWSVVFARDRVSPPDPPQDIELLKSETSDREVRIAWKPCRADVYRISRSDGVVAETRQPQWVDRWVEPDSRYVYQVQAVLWDQVSAAIEVVARTKPAVP